MVPCSGARVESCHSPCGQPLACGNHVCQIPCHLTKEQSKVRKIDCVYFLCIFNGIFGMSLLFLNKAVSNY